MRKLDIAITKAQLTGYNVSFREDGEISVIANIALLTESGRKVSDYSISTTHWQDENKFELPIECYAPIRGMAKALEMVVTQHCQDSLLKLEEPKPITQNDEF